MDDKKRGLGRGLSSLLGPEQNSSSTVVSWSQLTPGVFQPRRRFQEHELQGLADSISSKGILQPLIVRPRDDGFEIVAGERRWRAAKMAGLTEIPCLVRDLSDKESLEIAVLENIQRSDLNAIEEAESYRRLLEEFSYTQDQLSTVLGKSRSHIANTLRLLQLPAVVRDMLIQSLLTPGHVRPLVGHPDAVELAKEIVEKGLSVRQVESLTQKKKQIIEKTINAEVYSDIESLTSQLRQALGLNVDIRLKGNGGQIIIHYTTPTDLDFLMGRLAAAA